MFALDKRRRRRPLALLAAGCAAAATLWVVGAQANAATLPGKLVSGTFANSAGTLSYELYVPSTYRAGAQVPLVVAAGRSWSRGASASCDELRAVRKM